MREGAWAITRMIAYAWSRGVKAGRSTMPAQSLALAIQPVRTGRLQRPSLLSPGGRAKRRLQRSCPRQGSKSVSSRVVVPPMPEAVPMVSCV